MSRVDLDSFFDGRLMPAGVAQQRARTDLAAMKSGAFLRIGIGALDKRLRLVPGDVYFIGGRAASGKTALGMQIAYSALAQIQKNKEQASVAIFSAEMTAASLMLREASAQTNVPLESIILGEATPDEYTLMDESLREPRVAMENLYIDESPAPTLEHIAEQLTALRQASKLRLVVIDYLELVGEFAKTQQERVSKISKGLKGLAKQFDVPLVVLAQLNREIEKRTDKKVMLSDFMHGGEQAADVAIGLLRPWTYDITKPRELVEAHICKYRNGRTGVENLFFDERTLRFSTAVMLRQDLVSS